MVPSRKLKAKYIPTIIQSTKPNTTKAHEKKSSNLLRKEEKISNKTCWYGEDPKKTTEIRSKQILDMCLYNILSSVLILCIET